MKRMMALLLGMAMLVPGTGLPAQLTAKQILAKVSQTYCSLATFHFVERFESAEPGAIQVGPSPRDWCGPFGGCPARYQTDLALSTHGKLRLAVSSREGEILVVSNGRNTWAYIPTLNEYMEASAAPLLQELWRHPVDHVGDDLARYRGLSHEAGHAKLRGEETLSFGGRKVRCYVVDISSWQARRLWVDEQRFIVLRDRWAKVAAVSGSAPLDTDASLTTWTSCLTKADLGPISNSVFQFEPAGSARRVNSFTSPPGPRQNREEELAGLLTGWEMRNAGEGAVYSLQGTKAPGFTARGLDGEEVRLDKLRGKIVVVNFWASWCKPCRGELAAIQKLHDELASKGVIFLGVDDESPETVRTFVRAKGYTFPMLLDSDQKVHELYGVRWAPTTYVINPKGKIAAQYIGAGGRSTTPQSPEKGRPQAPRRICPPLSRQKPDCKTKIENLISVVRAQGASAN